MPITGIAFDLEGTVVDVERAHHEAHLSVGREVGVDFTLEEAIVKVPHFIGGPDEKIMAEIWELSNKTLSLAELQKKDKVYYHNFLQQLPIEPRPGFLEFLQQVKEQGIPTAIGSLTEIKEAKVLLERSHLTKWFSPEYIILREHVQNLKPAPDVFLETARRMEIEPEQQLVFEDSPRGITAARQAGSVAIGMLVYHQPEAVIPLLEAGALRIFWDWREVAVSNLLKSISR